MNIFNTNEVPLRSYIQSRITDLENALEEEVRNRDKVDIALLEQQFDRESENLILGITRQVHQVRDEIKTYRPTNINEPDYEQRMIQYRQFLQSSSISLNRMTNSIDAIFEKIKSIIKNVIRWIADNAQTIVQILEQICHAFKFIESFFIH
ncbi:unnamed protein product [Adineta ricciae]|uniref:Uncharacterized protein n=1 Tax=Adineta ricciae TaxID=249248 RepID=A0A815CAT6_ADIRI|nr:unnamed protein product [Adineta ricciae]CAF1484751.1 unnamed protein product [Adineta ricciae]